MGVVKGDNASNIISAFAELCAEEDEHVDEVIDEEPESDCDSESWIEDVGTELLDDDEVEEELHFDETLAGQINVDSFLESLNNEFSKKPTFSCCFAHLLQLAANDSIKQSTIASHVVRRVNAIISFFRKTNYWYDKLKSKGKGLCLIKPGTTRWSSTYHAMNRITKVIYIINRPAYFHFFLH